MSCCKFKTGSLRHRLTLQSNTPTVDSVGGQVDSYATYATVWGSLRPMRGKELINAQQIFAEVDHKAVIRYNATIAPTNRVLFDSRIFEVLAILDWDEMKVWQELSLKEVVDG